MWFGGGQTKSSIAEANRHLIALTDNVSELEEKLKLKDAELRKKEEDFTIAMQEVQDKRKLELKDLNALIFRQNVRIQRLEKDISARDTELAILRKRCRMFDEVLRYKATLGKLTITLEQAEQYASLTANARNYMCDRTGDTDSVNTDPAPLMIRDVPVLHLRNGEDQSIEESGSATSVPKLLHLNHTPSS
ncbi:unnamed protein product [Calicophoron daubneyi]|uniref:Uncharacterized protein n=1 Tax=Calicophoron daubneyi TaxID=300641 RepID=A0AAV2TQK1_CALDB